MRRHERGEDLCRASLIWLALDHWREPAQGRAEPVRDLRAWVERVTLGQLREWIGTFDDPELREWIERQVGWPRWSQGFGDRSG